MPPNLTADPEGAKAPLPSPAPYYVSEYVPGQRVVMEENAHYRGTRPHHVDRITIELGADASAVQRVERGDLHHVAGTPDLNAQLPPLVERYGINRSRVFVLPDLITRSFFLNTRRPLFANNEQLRQAFNFAVDRQALGRVYGRYTSTATDQYMPAVMRGFRPTRIYPLSRPDLRQARLLAKGRTRSGKAVMYACSDRPDCRAVAEVLKRNVKAIGIQLEIRQFPLQVMFGKLDNPSEPWDLVWLGLSAPYNDPAAFFNDFIYYTHLKSPRYTRQLERAGHLSGQARYRAYGKLDVELARDSAPAIGAMTVNTWAFVSAKTGCVVMNPSFDLTAVCLK